MCENCKVKEIQYTICTTESPMFNYLPRSMHEQHGIFYMICIKWNKMETLALVAYPRVLECVLINNSWRVFSVEKLKIFRCVLLSHHMQLTKQHLMHSTDNPFCKRNCNIQQHVINIRWQTIIQLWYPTHKRLLQPTSLLNAFVVPAIPGWTTQAFKHT